MICGKRIKMHSETAISNIHGIDALIILSSGSPVTFSAAYRHTPTGGVIRPKDSVMTRNTVKNSGDTPTAWQAGRRIGTRIKIAAVASINIPTTIRNAYRTNRMTIRLSEIPAIPCATLDGSPSISNNTDAGFAAMATNRIVPVDRAFLMMMRGISVHFRVLKT